MKETTAILLSICLTSMNAQCPTATPVKTTICTYTGGNWAHVPIKIIPPIVGSTTAIAYSWTAPPNATVSGSSTKTLQTNAAGVYTLTMTHTVTNCTDVSTHSVETCPPGTNLVGIEELTTSQEKTYFDLYGNQTLLKPGEILIEQQGNRRRKILIQ